MHAKTIALGLAVAAFLSAGLAQAGGPKPQHPCYGVADCKTQGSQKAFSACIKEHEAEANANAECAAFRKDKDSWMKANGVPGLEALFES